MYAVSARFLAALSTSHQIKVQVDAYYNGALTVADLPISGGSVTVDRGSKVQRKLSLTIPDPAYLPWSATDTLGPYGQTLVVSRGVVFPDGSTEMCPLGIFRVDEPSGDVDIGPVTVTGQSGEVYIQDDRFTAPTSTSGYGTCVAAITGLIQASVPAATVVNLTAGARNPACPTAVWDAGSDRWDAVLQIGTAMQAEVYVDVLGRYVITDVPDISTALPVWDVAAGATGNLVAASRKVARAGVYNAVQVTSENSSAGTFFTATATDTSPTSPTRWGGPFGKITKRYSSGLLTSTAACLATAQTMLRDATAPNVETSLSTLPNPALAAGDCIRATYAGRKDLFLVQAFSVPLDVGGDFPLSLRGSKEDTS
ncbi:DUF5047 domain-containing protein [Kitasatospora fiedleri]|uniref:DUF5047 domain-containing protein n=1 Tax=Kitasatospora fiedleri TaxID=2991545 RepID=UPI00249C3BE9|nr:DUF5047 domain-containing protein [Kitasatospora fiedleri]